MKEIGKSFIQLVTCLKCYALKLLSCWIYFDGLVILKLHLLLGNNALKLRVRLLMLQYR